jgi:acyl-CoA thioesterase-1
LLYYRAHPRAAIDRQRPVKALIPTRDLAGLRRAIAGLVVLASAGFGAPSPAIAQVIVAFGASNTYGKGVARSESFPAQLEAMLRARGRSVRVINAGINGDTTGGMLARLSSAVPAGTRLVILQPGNNDQRKGVGAARAGNIATIVAQLQARNIRVITLERILAGMSQYLQPDGQHLTAEGYRILAARVVPQVEAAIGGR